MKKPMSSEAAFIVGYASGLIPLILFGDISWIGLVPIAVYAALVFIGLLGQSS